MGKNFLFLKIKIQRHRVTRRLKIYHGTTEHYLSPKTYNHTSKIHFLSSSTSCTAIKTKITRHNKRKSIQLEKTKQVSNQICKDDKTIRERI
jgi:hypothetical protein